jgi:hypothetical protein
VRATPLLILLSLSLQSARADETWKEFESKEGGFKVLLPGTPTAQKMTQKAGDGSDVELAIYRLPPVGGTTFIVSTSDFAESYLKNPAEKILDNARDGSVTRSKGKLVSEKKVKLGDHPGREFVVSMPKDQGFIRARAYLVGKRQYTLLIAAKDDKAIATKEVEAFIDSFKLAK